MKNVLLVDDDQEILKLLQRRFPAEYRFFYASSPQQVSQNDLDSAELVLLDLHFPDGDGLRYCANLQEKLAKRTLPVFILTGESDSHTKVMGFSLGAEDFIVKPFDVQELKARIDSRFRRLEKERMTSEIVQKGDLTAEIPYQRVYLAKESRSEEVFVTPIEFKLLTYLMRNEERVLSRRQLIDAVWGVETHMTDRTVDQHVSRIRKKIIRSDYQIEARHGVGYCFCKPARR